MFDKIDRALKEYFTPSIFGTERVQEYPICITSLPIRMVVLGIHQPRREAPINHKISRASTAHAVVTILGEVDFDPLSNDAAMASIQKFGREHKV